MNGKVYDNYYKPAYELKYGKGFIKEYNYEGELISERLISYLTNKKDQKMKRTKSKVKNYPN